MGFRLGDVGDVLVKCKTKDVRVYPEGLRGGYVMDLWLLVIKCTCGGKSFIDYPIRTRNT